MKAPLGGRTVVILRSEERSTELGSLLRSLGAKVMACAVTVQVPVWNPNMARRIVSLRRQLSWLVFTSQFAVQCFVQILKAAGSSLDDWRAVRVATVGSRTALEAKRCGLKVHLVARVGGASELARLLLAKARVKRGESVLFPRSRIARRELVVALRSAGVKVISLPVYDTRVAGRDGIEPLLERIEADRSPEVFVIASPSALHACLKLLGRRGRARLGAEGATLVSIGPTTTSAITAAHLHVAAEARAPTPDGIVDAVLRSVGRAAVSPRSLPEGSAAHLSVQRRARRRK